MDLCMSYLREANQSIDQINELPLFESVFMEAEKLDKVTEENSMASEKSVSLLRKALNVVKGIYNTIKQIIKDFLDYIRLSSSEKDEFKKFEEECKNNPEFANKKITVKNWKLIEASYDAAIEATKKEIKYITQKEEEARPSVMKKINENLGKAAGVAKDAVVEMTIQKALSEASRSPEVARNLLSELDKDNMLNRQLEQLVGENSMKYTKKRLKFLSSKIGLVRWLAGARKQKANEVVSTQRGIMKTVKDFYKSLKHTAARNPDAKKVFDELDIPYNKRKAAKTAFRAGKGVLKEKHSIRQERKATEKENKIRQKQNDETRNRVETKHRENFINRLHKINEEKDKENEQ